MSAILGFLSGLLKAIGTLLIWKGGKDHERAEAAEGVIDDLYLANQARDRLKHDPEYAKRVRERFTR